MVEQTLSSGREALKERTIAIAVFGRSPDYDSSSDATVRVTANEVRKRLAQYQREADPNRDDGVEISLPAGCYTPEFRRICAVPRFTAAATRWAHVSTRSVGLIMAALSVLVLVILWLVRKAPEPLDAFWDPLVQNKRPALILFYSGILYDLSDRVKAKYSAQPPAEPMLADVDVPDSAVLTRKDLISKPGMSMGNGDAYAIVRIAAMLAVKGKDYLIEKGNDAAFSAFRNHSCVLIGAFNNPWTLQMTRDARFVFERDPASGNRPVIRDRQVAGSVYALPAGTRTLAASEDFAIVSRVLHPETGQLLVLLAGITQNGTRAAGEFASNRQLMAEGLHRAPKGWQRMNVQLLLRLKVVNGTPAQARVEVTHFW